MQAFQILCGLKLHRHKLNVNREDIGMNFFNQKKGQIKSKASLFMNTPGSGMCCLQQPHSWSQFITTSAPPFPSFLVYGIWLHFLCISASYLKSFWEEVRAQINRFITLNCIWEAALSDADGGITQPSSSLVSLRCLGAGAWKGRLLRRKSKCREMVARWEARGSLKAFDL